ELCADSRFTNRLEQPHRAERGDFTGVFGDVEADANMALCPKVVDFVRTNFADDPIQRAGVVEVAIDQPQMRIRLMLVFVNVIDSTGVEGTGSAHDAINRIAFG